MKLVKNENEKKINEVTDKEAEEAFVKILKWLGEDPTREGLLETPKRVTKAFKEYLKSGDKFLIDCCKQHISSNYGNKSKEMKSFKLAVSEK